VHELVLRLLRIPEPRRKRKPAVAAVCAVGAVRVCVRELLLMRLLVVVVMAKLLLSVMGVVRVGVPCVR
jgi:hypothetical protein